MKVFQFSVWFADKLFMNKFFLVYLVGFCLTACATTRPAFVNNGAQVYEATCNGLARSMTDCYEQAAEQCRGNFKPVGQDSTNSIVPVDGQLYGVNKRSLLFTCN